MYSNKMSLTTNFIYMRDVLINLKVDVYSKARREASHKSAAAQKSQKLTK